MKTTKYQSNTLKGYLKFQNNPPTVLKLISLNLAAFIFFLIAFCVGIVLIVKRFDPHFGYILVGMSYGMAMITIINFRYFIKFWPVLKEILNWEKVKKVYEEKTPNDKRIALSAARSDAPQSVD